MAVSFSSIDTPDPASQRAKRILVASRRFWPHAGMSEMAIAELAHQIQQNKHNVSVVSSLGAKTWTTEINFREIPVHRIARIPASPWSSFRYLRAFTKYFSGQSNVDGVIVSGTGDEALAATRVFAGKVPIVLRIDNDVSDTQSVPHRRVIDVLKAASHVVSNCQHLADRMMQSYGVPIKTIRDCVPAHHDERTYAGQHNSRAVLNETHPILSLDPDQPLVLCGRRMTKDAGMMDLIESWPRVQQSHPDAKLWIVGDGPVASQVWQRIVKLNLVHSIILPGYFDNMDDLFLSADVVVHPAREPGACEFLPRALAFAVPPIVTKTEWTDSLIDPKQTGLVIPPQNPQAMAEAIIYALNNKPVCQQLGERARQLVNRLYCPQQQARKYLQLFETPTAARRSN